MVLEEVYGIKVPHSTLHEVAMSHWRAVAEEERTSGALWNNYESLYWETRMSLDPATARQWLMATSCNVKWGSLIP